MSVDTRGREAAERALAAVDRIDVPEVSALLTRRRRRQLSRIAVVGVASVLVVTAIFVTVLGSANDPTRTSRVQVQPTAPISKAEIEFREVRLTVPLNGSPAGGSCPAPETLHSPPAGEMFADRTGTTCYILGPALLTGAGINSASVAYDTTSSSWVVDTKWDNDEFVTEIAQPLVGRQIAILSDGIVQSALTINPGITGRDIAISGTLGRADAINLAASMMGIAPSAVPVDTSGGTPNQ